MTDALRCINSGFRQHSRRYFGAFSISSMAEDYQILVPDSQEDGDSIYKTYLETLTGILGKDEAYRILDSFSDGAKARQAAAISEIEITVPGDGSADTVEAAGTTEEQETPGVIEEVRKIHSRKKYRKKNRKTRGAGRSGNNRGAGAINR